MANSNNAYATVRPLQGNVSDWVNQEEGMNLAYRQEQRQIDALDQARRDKAKAKEDQLRQKLLGNVPQNYNTGSSSLNQFQAGIIQKGVNRLGEIYKELKRNDLSDNERIDLELEAQNINNLPENLKVATDNFSKLIADYQKGVDSGVYFRNPDFEKKVLNGFDNYVGALDNGLPVVGFIDRDGDGVMDVMPYENLSQSLGPDNNNTPWNFQKQFDLDKLAVATGEKLGKTETTTDGNFIKRTIKGPDLKSLAAITDNIMTNPDGSLTDVAKSELRKRGLSTTPDNLEKVKQIFKERVLAYTDRSDKTDVDYAGRTGAAKEARISRQEREKASRGGSGKNREYTLNDLGLTANNKATSGDKSEIVGNIYQGNVDIVREAGGAKESFRSFTVDSNGDVVVTVDVPVKVGDDKIVETKKYNSKNNADIVSFFATRFKDPETGQFIKNIPELKTKLKTLGETPLGNTSGAYDDL